MSEPGPGEQQGTGQPGTGLWREAEASRLIEFGRAAALPDGGFGWLCTDGRIDPAQPRPLYINARMTYVFALAHLTGVAGAGALAASGLDALASRYADREHGGWFASLDPAGLGRIAVERLLQRIEDPGAPVRRRTVLPVRLIPRGSGELPPRA